MKVAFPRFGYDTCALRTFVEDMGAEVVLPPETSKRTLELGVVHSPELVCLPFKITLGNFIEAAELGADTMIMAAGARKCRFGYYHYLQERVMKGLYPGCRVVPVGQYSLPDFFFRAIPELFGVPASRVMRATAKMLAKSRLTLGFRRALNRKRALDFEWAELARPKVLRQVEAASTMAGMNALQRRLPALFGLNGEEPELRLLLGGEIYFTVVQFANSDIEKELAKMGAEVIFERSLFHHILHLLHMNPVAARSHRLSREYLRECPGGEARRTVGEAVHYSRQGIDGIVHVFPFTCMPENIALEGLNRIGEKTGVPILSLSFDEHTSHTGLLTRLEAFVDLVKRRKRGRGIHRN